MKLPLDTAQPMTEDPVARLSPALKARILAAARREPVATRAQIRGRAGAVLLAGLGGALGVFAIAGGVHIVPRPSALAAATSIGSGVIAALALWLTLTRGRSMLGRSRGVLIALAVGAPAVLLAWKFGLSAAFDMVQRWPTRPGLRCLLLTVSMGAFPLVASLFLRAHSDPVKPAATGASFGVAAGVGVAFLVDLWCPVAYLPHLLVGHLLPIAILAGAGALLGAQLLAVRA